MKEVFEEVPDKRKVLWGGDYGTYGYYFAMVSVRGDMEVTRKYIQGQGRIGDIKQMRHFEL